MRGNVPRQDIVNIRKFRYISCVSTFLRYGWDVISQEIEIYPRNIFDGNLKFIVVLVCGSLLGLKFPHFPTPSFLPTLHVYHDCI